MISQKLSAKETADHALVKRLRSLRTLACSKWARVALLGMAITLFGTGCAVYPDYSPYYGSYGYVDSPWDYGVGGPDIFIGGGHRGYYGHHHFGHEFHGGGFRGGGFHGGFHGGGHGHR